MPRVSIVIPTYNAKENLKINLPALFQELHGRNDTEVVIVDDGSTDGTSEFLAATYPQARIKTLEKNTGAVSAWNTGVRLAQGDVLYCLNSDARVLPGFLDPVLRHFKDPKIFAVGSKGVFEDADSKLMIPEPFFRFGLFGHRYREYRDLSGDAVSVDFVSTGHAAFSKEKMLSLDAFDELYRPIYWEDVDLCYRALKKGWKILAEPQSRVHHKGHSLSDSPRLQTIYWKNRFLFCWKNLDDPALLLRHALFLPWIAATLPLTKGWMAEKGLMMAVKQLPEVIQKRRLKAPAEVSDRDILRRFS